MSDEMMKDVTINEEVKNTYDSLHAPDTWKQETLLKMKEEEIKVIQKDVKKEKNSKKSLRLNRFAVATATLCVAALCLFIILPKGAPYVTKMDEGIYYDDVELKDGEIHFLPNRMAISITPNAGNTFNTTEEMQENATEVLPSESGGMLTFQKTKSRKLPEIAKSNWSYIGEQKIYVTVLKTEEVRYQAIYEKDGETYELIGEGVTQKEFVDELYDRVTK